MSEYFEVYNEKDELIKKAVELLGNNKEYAKLLSGK
jgi:hypothetical protein